jgi:hypothetical protein
MSSGCQRLAFCPVTFLLVAKNSSGSSLAMVSGLDAASGLTFSSYFWHNFPHVAETVRALTGKFELIDLKK